MTKQTRKQINEWLSKQLRWHANECANSDNEEMKDQAINLDILATVIEKRTATEEQYTEALKALDVADL